jgi:hypothetical protein
MGRENCFLFLLIWEELEAGDYLQIQWPLGTK